VLPGWRIPADGEVLEGCSYINEAMITGGGDGGPRDDFFGAAVICSLDGASGRLVAGLAGLLL
jgi:high-affinity K+ transport system ATPase subunit B